MLKCLCIIPARGLSKRIPKKNIKEFNGRPIIAYAIEKAHNTKLFQDIIVSTDDIEIKQCAEKYGAEVPFLRSSESANDTATMADVMNQVLLSLTGSGKVYDYACCLLATSVLVKIDSIIAGFNALKEGENDSVISISKFNYPIQRALIIKEGYIEFTNPEYRNTRSQDLLEHYHDAGQWYWFKLENGLIKNYWPNNSGYIELNEWECQDIDTFEDWKMAEVKYKYLEKNEEDCN